MSQPPPLGEEDVAVGQPFSKPTNRLPTDGAVTKPMSLCRIEEDSDVKRHPTPIAAFLITARVLTGIIAATAVGSIVFAAIAIGFRTKAYNDKPSEDTSWTAGFTQCLCSLTIVESVLCLAAALTCFGLLFTHPHHVLTRNPSSGPFGCLCASIFILFLCAIYSCCITAMFGDFKNGATVGFALVPGIRVVSLISFFGVLVANSRREPFDQ